MLENLNNITGNEGNQIIKEIMRIGHDLHSFCSLPLVAVHRTYDVRDLSHGQ